MPTSLKCVTVHKNAFYLSLHHTSSEHLIRTPLIEVWVLPIIVFQLREKPFLLLWSHIRPKDFSRKIVRDVCEPRLLSNGQQPFVWKLLINRHVIACDFIVLVQTR